MPVSIALAHDVAIRLINCKGRHQSEVALKQLVNSGPPGHTAACCSLLPKITGLFKAPLLIRIIVVCGIVLNSSLNEHRFWKTIPMLHTIETKACTVQCVHLIYAVLIVMTGGTQTQLLGLVIDCCHSLCRATA